jgi:hypothetical protein
MVITLETFVGVPQGFVRVATLFMDFREACLDFFRSRAARALAIGDKLLVLTDAELMVVDCLGMLLQGSNVAPQGKLEFIEEPGLLPAPFVEILLPHRNLTLPESMVGMDFSSIHGGHGDCSFAMRRAPKRLIEEPRLATSCSSALLQLRQQGAQQLFLFEHSVSKVWRMRAVRLDTTFSERVLHRTQQVLLLVGTQCDLNFGHNLSPVRFFFSFRDGWAGLDDGRLD